MRGEHRLRQNRYRECREEGLEKDIVETEPVASSKLSAKVRPNSTGEIAFSPKVMCGLVIQSAYCGVDFVSEAESEIRA